MKKVIMYVENGLFGAAVEAVKAWQEYYNTPAWDKHKKRLTHRVGERKIVFKIHESKTGTIIVHQST